MLELIAFFSGALVMVLEMVGGRVLAPHVGTSAIVWTSLIGVVLACLAFGAWLGGRYADRDLSRKGLSFALAAAGCGTGLTAFLHVGIGEFVTSSISSLYLSAVAAAIGIFAIPAIFFGMITPYIIRLRLASLENAGATVGRLYALSTAGSIVGTFLGGFVLVSWFGCTWILWGVAIAMLSLSLLNALARPLPRASLLCLFCLLAILDWNFQQFQEKTSKTHLVESPYNVVRIQEGLDPGHGSRAVRLMATDPGYSQSGMLVDEPDKLYFDYTRYYALGPLFVPGARKILMLGGGGYSVPKWLLSSRSGLDGGPTSLTVVELDPAMTGIAEKWFALKPDPRMRIEHGDARIFLARNQEKHDLVFVDVFNSHYSVPFHIGTVEAARELRRAVAPGGAVLMNIISAVEGPDGRLFRAIYHAMAKSFGSLAVYLVGRPDLPARVQNIILVAFPEEGRKAEAAQMAAGRSPESSLQAGVDPGREEIRTMLASRYGDVISQDTPPLTDDFAPVERYAMMLLKD